MSFCIKCGNPISEESKFCSKCGAAVVTSTEPVYEAPAASYVPPVQEVPVATAQPVVSTRDKVLGFVGMGLAIFGLVMAALGTIYTIAGMIETGLGFAFSMIFGMLSVAPCIVGRIMATNSAKAGNPSGACTAGATVSIVGIIVSGVMLFLGFINLLI